MRITNFQAVRHLQQKLLRSPPTPHSPEQCVGSSAKFALSCRSEVGSPFTTTVNVLHINYELFLPFNVQSKAAPSLSTSCAPWLPLDSTWKLCHATRIKISSQSSSRDALEMGGVVGIVDAGFEVIQYAHIVPLTRSSLNLSTSFVWPIVYDYELVGDIALDLIYPVMGQRDTMHRGNAFLQTYDQC